MREKWKELLTGGSLYDPADENIAAQLSLMASAAHSYWATLDTSPDRTYLWSDLSGTFVSSCLKENYSRIKALVLAYSCKGSSLENNKVLLSNIIDALDWMYNNRYNENVTRYDNWWHWDIGVPLELCDIVLMLYDQLSPTQIANYMNAVERFQSQVSKTGANRVWACLIIAARGIIVNDSDKIASARDGLSQVFNYVTAGDGFYTDGSFIQHDKNPYTGGYGLSLLKEISKLMYVLDHTAWAVTDDNKSNVYRWIYESYEPLIYKGAMMDMTRGREISRMEMQDHVAGHCLIESVIRVTQFAPQADAAAFKRMVKYLIGADRYWDFFEHADIPMIILGKAIMNDARIESRGELIKHYQFPRMDRVVHLRPHYGFGISMSSNRIYNYESINNENFQAWYTADGMTYIYNNDLAHYSDHYWPTVNKYRLPGTTVDTQVRHDLPGDYVSVENQVGGTSLHGLNGISSMSLKSWGSNLQVWKSWFMYGDVIVALGAGITNTEQVGLGWDGTRRKVETIIENRKLNKSANPVLTVNGEMKSTAVGWSETITDVRWAHMTSDISGADIGYYFPEGATVMGLYEARTSSWKTINDNGRSDSITRDYMALWLDHGTNPRNQTYSYVLLPGKSNAEVCEYVRQPSIVILENTAFAQAVKENTLNIVGVNYWTDTLKWVQVDGRNYVSSNKRASVMICETKNDIEVAVSDTTQVNTGTISIEINNRAKGTLFRDPEIHITQLSPTIKLDVNVDAAYGKTFKLKLSY